MAWLLKSCCTSVRNSAPAAYDLFVIANMVNVTDGVQTDHGRSGGADPLCHRNAFEHASITANPCSCQSGHSDISEDDVELDDLLSKLPDEAFQHIYGTAFTSDVNQTPSSARGLRPPDAHSRQQSVDLSRQPSIKRAGRTADMRTVNGSALRQFGRSIINTPSLQNKNFLSSAPKHLARNYSVQTEAPKATVHKAALRTNGKEAVVAKSSRSKALRRIDEIKRAQKQEARRELNRQRDTLERFLVRYSYTRPAGVIESMKKGAPEIESERNDLQLILGPGDRRAHIAVLSSRLPVVHICSTTAEADRILPKVRSGEIVSFDMEWVEARRLPKRTSVIQIASATDIFIVQLESMSSVPTELARVLSDPTIIKCGVSIKSDATKYKKDFGLAAEGLLELSALAKVVDKERWVDRVSMIALRDLCRIYLNRKLDKNPDVRQGRWDRKTLDEEQLHYAASDVYVGLEIVHALVAMALQAPNYTPKSKKGPRPSTLDVIRNLMGQQVSQWDCGEDKVAVEAQQASTIFSSSATLKIDTVPDHWSSTKADGVLAAGPPTRAANGKGTTKPKILVKAQLQEDGEFEEEKMAGDAVKAEEEAAAKKVVQRAATRATTKAVQRAASPAAKRRAPVAPSPITVDKAFSDGQTKTQTGRQTANTKVTTGQRHGQQATTKPKKSPRAVLMPVPREQDKEVRR